MCDVFLGDPLPPSFQTLNIRTKKQELRQSEGFLELPPFYLAELQMQKKEEEHNLLLTHQRRHIPLDKAQADDIWALASSVVTISTGTFLLRKENHLTLTTYTVFRDYMLNMETIKPQRIY